MTKRHNAVRSLSTRDGMSADPFGAGPLTSPIQATTTMADAVRRCRWIAVDINADAFLLLLLGPPEEKRLIHAFDTDFPAVSVVSRLIVSRAGEDLVRHASVSTTPRWWAPHGASIRETFAAIQWCERQIPGPPDQTGIAFPVFADRGQAGLVIFVGDDMTMDEATLYETHARSFALFWAVTRLRPVEGGAMPAISRRELECLSLTANGLTSEEIAAELRLSVHTANQYLTNTAQKLNAVNRMHAVAKALRLGLIE